MEKIQIGIEKQKVIDEKLLSIYKYGNNTIPFIVYSMNYCVGGENLNAITKAVKEF